jgi:SurA N-terminal domain
MFGTIRKHQTWLWAIIITLTIISFVVFFSPYSKLNSGRGPANLGSIYSERVSEEQFVQAQREVYLQFFFMRGGRWPDEQAKAMGFDEQRETYQWLLLIHNQERMGIHFTSEVVAAFAKEMLAQFQRAGLSSPDAFMKQVLEPHGFQVEDFERFVRHYLGIQELISTVGLSGKLVTPQEAKELYVREHEELVTEAVFFSPSNYFGNVIVTPDVISQFHSNRAALYAIPERVQVKYVKFDLTNYLAEAKLELAKMTNLEERIDMVYQQRGTNYYKDAKSPAEAKEKIREETRKDLMTVSARKKANEFATKLFDITPPVPENLVSLAKSNGLPVKVSLPFDRNEGPKEIEGGPDFAARAFALTTNEPFAEPLVGKDGVYVIAMDRRLPSEIPSLEQVREKVVADYRYIQATNLVHQAGQSFYANLTNGLAQGKPFSAIAVEAKLRPVTLPPFSISTRELPELEERITLNELKQLAFGTPIGKAGRFYMSNHGFGIIAFVKAKLPPDETKMKADLPAFMNYVRSQRQNEAFQEWFRKEAAQGLRDTPLSRPRPAPSMSPKSGKS